MKVRIFATRVSSSGDGVKIPARIIPAPLLQRHKITACRPNCGNGTIIPASGTERSGRAYRNPRWTECRSRCGKRKLPTRGAVARKCVNDFTFGNETKSCLPLVTTRAARAPGRCLWRRSTGRGHGIPRGERQSGDETHDASSRAPYAGAARWQARRYHQHR